MQELSRALSEKIVLPSVQDKELWRSLAVDFTPGEYYLPLRKVEIDEKKQIKVDYCEIGPGIAKPHLINVLFSHLGTSGFPKFSELAGEKRKLKNLVLDVGLISYK